MAQHLANGDKSSCFQSWLYANMDTAWIPAWNLGSLWRCSLDTSRSIENQGPYNIDGLLGWDPAPAVGNTIS